MLDEVGRALSRETLNEDGYGEKKRRRKWKEGRMMRLRRRVHISGPCVLYERLCERPFLDDGLVRWEFLCYRRRRERAGFGQLR